jgi:hypothetical protein
VSGPASSSTTRPIRAQTQRCREERECTLAYPSVPVRLRSGQALRLCARDNSLFNIVRNKPNFLPAFQEGAKAEKAVPAGATRPKRAKRSQFPPDRHEGEILCWKGVMTNWTHKGPRQNEANSGTEGNGRWSAWLPVPPTGPVVQTNPMCRRRQGRPAPRSPALTMPPRRERTCETKPISGGAKRTQFAADGHGGPASRPPALTMPPRRGQTCETKPISGGAKRAKRTQFAPDGYGGPAPRSPVLTTPPVRRAGAPNKANLPAYAGHTHIRGQTRIPLPPTPQAVSLGVAGSDGPMPRGCWTNSVQWGYSWFQDGYQRMPDWSRSRQQS